MEKKLLLALTDIRDDYIMDTMVFLGYDRAEKPLIRSGRKGLVLLLAAALTVLLAITALALDLFGLRSYLVPSPAGEIGGYISQNGYTHTLEGEAAAEWAEFCRNYDLSARTDADVEAWIGGDPSRLSLERIYGVKDDFMAEKLRDLQDKYGLTLHTRQVFSSDWEVFRRAAGVSPFLHAEEHEFQPLFIFEDGSFRGEGSVTVNGVACDFTLIRGRRGALTPTVNYLADPGDYVNFQCPSTSGVPVDAAWFSTGSDKAPCFLFYSDRDDQITVFGSVPDSREAVCSFAGCFDFSALCGGEPDLTVFDRMTPAKTGPEGLLTWEVFTGTPEWKAAAEFSSYCQADPVLRDPFIQDRALHSRGNGALDAEMERICAEYGLVCPVYKEFYVNYYGAGRAYPYEGNGVPDGAEWYDIDTEKFWARLGSGPLLEIESIPITDWYDTGAFRTGPANMDLCYLPKGVLFTASLSLPSDYRIVESWAYETAGGDTVQCFRTDRPEGLILYETEQGYVLTVTHTGGTAAGIQAAADRIFFSRVGQ